MVPRANNSIQKTHTPSSESCEAKEDHSGVYLQSKMLRQKSITYQWGEVIRSLLFCYVFCFDR